MCPAVSDALAVLHEGTQNRQVAATDMNAASSRSHCIFTCHIESRLEPQAGMVNVRSSRCADSCAGHIAYQRLAGPGCGRLQGVAVRALKATESLCQMFLWHVT